MGDDPHYNDLNVNMNMMNQANKTSFVGHKVRARNRRGQYETLDPVGSVRSPRTADNGTNRSQFNEARKAENRLRMIEQISKYREEKIKREFLKLEEDLHMEDDRKQKEYMKEQRLQAYHNRQKDKLMQFAQIKSMREQERMMKEMAERQSEIDRQRSNQQRNHFMKQKIQMYKEFKAQQIMELQMQEQQVIAGAKRSDRIRLKKLNNQ